MIRKILKSKRAEGYLDVVIGVVALVMFIVIALNIFTFVTLKTTIDRIADDLIEVATFSGSFGDDFNAKVDQLKNKYFDFEVETYVEKYYNAEHKRVQIGDDMGFTIRVNASVAGISIALPIDVTASRIGQSEQYWKPATGIYENPVIDNSGKMSFALNIKTKKFHFPECSSLVSLSSANRHDVYSTAAELVSVGYSPCTICNPHDCVNGDVAFYNAEGHWGYCEMCDKAGALEKHTLTYNVEYSQYRCIHCNAIVEGDTMRCPKGAVLTNEAHAMNCDCVVVDPAPDPNKIPADAVYLAADGTQYVAGDTFPALSPADVYTLGNYSYCYGYAWCNEEDHQCWSHICGHSISIDGWGVKCINDVANPGKIQKTISEEPVVSMSYTFYNCVALDTAPILPDGVTDMSNAFYGCTALITAPEIPHGVTNMNSAFYGCTALTTASEIPGSVTDIRYMFYKCSSLTGTITINANPQFYSSCFYLSTAGQDITITGTSPKLKAIANTSTKGKRIVYDIDGNILKQ